MHRNTFAGVTGTGIKDLLAEIVGTVIIGGHTGLINGIIGVAAEIGKYISGSSLVYFISFHAPLDTQEQVHGLSTWE
ncbi:hypothetical protein BDW66DRAFT_121975 [Aspergillus desertorum]